MQNKYWMIGEIVQNSTHVQKVFRKQMQICLKKYQYYFDWLVCEQKLFTQV